LAPPQQERLVLKPIRQLTLGIWLLAVAVKAVKETLPVSAGAAVRARFFKERLDFYPILYTQLLSAQQAVAVRFMA
jgi:hypothetical protein